jgi:hypothetical protein
VAKRCPIAVRKASGQAPSAISGAASAGDAWPTTAAAAPSHITGATTGTASRLAGTVTHDRRPNVTAMSGVVLAAAATHTASASAAGSGRRGQRRAMPARSGGASPIRPSTAAKLSCQPGSPALRGFSARVLAAASSSA